MLLSFLLGSAGPGPSQSSFGSIQKTGGPRTKRNGPGQNQTESNRNDTKLFIIFRNDGLSSESIVPRIIGGERSIMATLPKDVIRQQVITIRKQTKTRDAIRIVVTQEQTQGGALCIPTIELIGSFPHEFESPRFAFDLARALSVAAWFAEEWSQYVNGKR